MTIEEALKQLKEGVKIKASEYGAEPDVGIMQNYYELDDITVKSDFSGKPLDTDESYVIKGCDPEDSQVGTWEEWLQKLEGRHYELGEQGYEEALKEYVTAFHRNRTFEDVLKEISEEPETATIVEYAHAETGEPVYEMPGVWEIEPEDLGLARLDRVVDDLDYDYFDNKYGYWPDYDPYDD